MRRLLFKRSVEIALTAAMIATMAGVIPVAAAANDGYTKVYNIEKEIHLDDENTERSDLTIYAPSVTYTYTITPATEAELSIDGAKKVPLANPATGAPDYTVDVDGIIVKSGSDEANLTVNSSVSTTFLNTESVVDPATGNSSTGIINHTIDLAVTDVNGAAMPGIYRYKIVESTPVVTGTFDTTTVITHDASYNDTRFLDVFVGYADPTGDSEVTEIKYVVMFKLTNGDPIKTMGWTNDTNATSKDIDEYLTEDLIIEKETTGSLADKTNRFPFAVNLTGVKDAKFTYKLSAAGSADSVNTLANSAFTDSYSSINLKHNEKVTFYGLPNNTTFLVNEKNNTYDLYTVSAKLNGSTDLLTDTDVAADATTTLTAPQNITVQTQADTVHFTNKIKEVSPTGLAFRFLQFAMMTAIGGMFLFFLLFMKRRNDDEDDASYSVA